MPIYDYLCQECGKAQQHFVRNRNDYKPCCKHCGSHVLVRQLSQTAFHLKGDGWYHDGYGLRGGESTSKE